MLLNTINYIITLAIFCAVRIYCIEVGDQINCCFIFTIESVSYICLVCNILEARVTNLRIQYRTK